MEINLGLVGSFSEMSLSSDGLSNFLVGCQILHEEFGLGTVRAIDVDTQRCQIQLDRRDVTIDCSLAELAGKGGYGLRNLRLRHDAASAGRPPNERAWLFNAFVAKAVLGLLSLIHPPLRF